MDKMLNNLYETSPDQKIKSRTQVSYSLDHTVNKAFRDTFMTWVEMDENDENYGVYRMAIYLQDHRNGGGLSVVPASHLIPENEHKLFNNININQFEDPFYIPTKAGDCILFDVRLLHKGEPYTDNRYSIFTAMGTDNEFSKQHAKGAIDRQLRQNFQEEYLLQPYMKDLLENLNIVY